MNANATPVPVHDRRIRLRTGAFDAWCRRRYGERVTQVEVAEALGIHPTTLSQYRRGRRSIGRAAIVAMQEALPGAKFEDLFEVVA